MNESFVDLSYRGLSLGRRIKLTQVRPSSGYVELPSPMPVGTQIALVTDDGVAFDATVAWIHEQIAGADRPPGMVVIPELGSEAAAVWWKARVALPEDDTPRPRPRSRPVTVRPRTHTKPTPPTSPVVDMSAIKADLEARVTAAARVEAPSPAPTEPVSEPDDPAMGPPRTAGISSEHAVQRPDEDDEPEMTVSTDDDAMPEPPPVLRRTGEHAVVDDGKPTVIMQSVDPEALGLDFPVGEVTDPGRPPRAGSPIPGEPTGESMDDGPTDPGNGVGRDRR
ncbi:MAG TPA: hypothetical protein VLM79_00325 [Kofleriaceae bacterium]|nr:hypothetical protein [Kofleriaceae bacterium]